MKFLEWVNILKSKSENPGKKKAATISWSYMSILLIDSLSHNGIKIRAHWYIIRKNICLWFYIQKTCSKNHRHIFFPTRYQCVLTFIPLWLRLSIRSIDI